MANTSKNATPARVTFLDGRGDLPMVEITTTWSTAEIYLHGAHVTNFKKHGEAPLLFLSQCSRFEANQPIRGGIPVIFPWFGAREGLPMHGFARVKSWEIKEVLPAADGTVSVRFGLPDSPEAGAYSPFLAEYVVTVNESLKLELIVTNKSADETLEFEECFHTYFSVEDIAETSIAGLKGISYLDKVANFAKKTEMEDAIRVESEVDRVYLDAPGAVEIRDARLGRVIRIEKDNSASTVVWNPWVAKAQQMPDFGNEEYQKMVCVESGNVNANKIILGPGTSLTMRVTLSSAAK
ncbi:MAG TPA: D-hexose-6-phosphate mutarotase [Verrucomicrobiae bacterium]|jgi:D-hexose-6-phosphate mutarotase|nr:D-hexose-6-phosphate mutarotase [Verrucomicrobiae bacterium]